MSVRSVVRQSVAHTTQATAEEIIILRQGYNLVGREELALFKFSLIGG